MTRGLGGPAAAVLLLSLLAGSALAQATHPSENPATVSELVVTATKMVEELTVTAKVNCLEPDRGGGGADRPKVVSAFPARDALVRPGLLVMRVTFNRPMACDGRFHPNPPLQDPCPGAIQQMLMSVDRRTIRTVCFVEPDLRYGSLLNSDLSFKVFMGLAGLPAEAHVFRFATSSGPAVTTVCEALAEDEAGAREIRKFRKLDCSGPPSPEPVRR